ncbi:DNA-directed RNA polymerase subunit alpha [Patescibacteria group bacterium]|nr:DNA-directed RNA polymerase subunit alpha [Patescibacteria group bacterium]
MKINLPQKPKAVKPEGNRAIFEIEGLYPGYGVTLGNALRRVLLSSLSGAAVTGVKIKGVHHEFSTIPHVMEDVVEIILNLRQIRFKMHGEESVKLFLNAKGEKIIKAGDIKASSDVEIINKDAVIASLTDKKAELEMEIEVEPGFGFVPVESRKKEKLEIGLIAIDAAFSPLRRVNFEVENMRVGDRTDFNRLRLDIETDGSVSPEEAFRKASEILVDQFKSFIETQDLQEPEGEEKTDSKEKEGADDVTKIKIEDLKLSARTLNALLEGGIKTVGRLIKKTEEALEEIEGIGDRGVSEVKKALKKLDLALKSKEETIEK